MLAALLVPMMVSLRLKNSLNKTDVFGVRSLNNANNYNGLVNSYTGGIIGEIYNETESGSSLTYLKNIGAITAGAVPGKSGSDAQVFAGGIFGSLRGYGF